MVVYGCEYGRLTNVLISARKLRRESSRLRVGCALPILWVESFSTTL